MEPRETRNRSGRRASWVIAHTLSSIVLLGLGLEPGPIQAAPAKSSAPNLVVAGPVLAGAFDEDDRGRLREGLRSGILRNEDRGQTRIREIEPVWCDSAGCARKQLGKGGTHLMTVQVSRVDRDYAVVVELRDRSGELVARREETCEICGIDEVVGVVSSAGAMVSEQIWGTPTFGTAVIDTNPPGAIVRTGERELGQTPVVIELRPGTYTLAFEKWGYEPATRDVSLEAGIQTRASIDLVPKVNAKRSIALGATLTTLGVISLGAGITLIALEGRPYQGRCDDDDIDEFGNCPLVYTTKWGGIGAAAAGATLLGAGLTTLLLRPNRKRTSVSLSRRGVVVQRRF